VKLRHHLAHLRPNLCALAKYWAHVLTEIKNRGVADVCIVVCDGLTGLPDAVTATWPLAIVQTCVVHYADARIMPMLIEGPVWVADFWRLRSA
jgi:Transposase, Mutator family